MAKYIGTNGYVMVNSVDLSSYVSEAVLEQEGSAVETTGMSSTGDRTFLPGLKGWSLVVEFFQDYASSQVHATLKSLVNTTTTIAVRSVNATIAATNPEYQGSAILLSYTPVTAQLGQPGKFRATFQGTGALSEDVSP